MVDPVVAEVELDEAFVLEEQLDDEHGAFGLDADRGGMGWGYLLWLRLR